MPDKEVTGREVYACQANRGGETYFFKINQIQEDTFRVSIDTEHERKLSVDLPGGALSDAFEAVVVARAL